MGKRESKSNSLVAQLTRRGMGLALGMCAVFSAAAQAELDYGFCLVCHGSETAGNPVIRAPNLTVLQPWYLEMQLKAFRDGYRGWHPDDEHGHSMASAARALTDDAAIEGAVRFVTAYPARSAQPTLTVAAPAAATDDDAYVDEAHRLVSDGTGDDTTLVGDAGRGEALYQACSACHGEDGIGNETLRAPTLAGQNDWYLVKALGDYRKGYRGHRADDQYASSMRMAAMQLGDEQAVYDVVSYIQSFSQDGGAAAVPVVTQSEESDDMKTTTRKSSLRAVLPAVALAAASGSVLAHDVTRYPLPNGSTFPIAQAVTVPAGTELTFHSGLLPAVADPDAEPGTRAYLGDTYTQTMSVLQQFEASLKAKGMGLGNIIKMNVYLVGDPELDGKMDFAGFMRAYSQFFGTEEQPHLPARAAIQIAGLARGAFIEIEVIAAR